MVLLLSKVKLLIFVIDNLILISVIVHIGQEKGRRDGHDCHTRFILFLEIRYRYNSTEVRNSSLSVRNLN